MIFEFIFNKKKIKIDVIVCDTVFKKMKGLMFRKNSKPLLFLFNKPVNEPIHSFFCVPLIAIWFLDDKIVDIKYVKPWKFRVKPRLKFNKLLEIPKSSKNFSIFRREIIHDDRKI